MHISRTSRLAVLAVLAALAATASIAPAASAAAQRYASPAGGGSCSSASPCSITQAISGASAGDEVIVNPGDYPLAATLSAPSQITIHGVAGQPRPRLRFSGAGQDGLRVQSGSALLYVEVDQAAANTALYANSSTMDRVIARGTGTGYATAMIRDSEIRNSTVIASGANGQAIATVKDGGFGTSTYRNVTAIATGSGGVAIKALAQGAGTVAAINLVNVIARGGPGGPSLVAVTDNSGAQAKITATHTNYQSVYAVDGGAKFVDGGGNRAEEPAFVNPAAGDYHQAAGAYTIDAGLNDSINGAFDVDGDPRTIGTTDIGADEFVPATTPPATPPPTTPPLPTSPSARPFAGVRLVSTRLTYARRAIPVRLRCPARTVGRCSGKTKLTARRRTSSRRVTLGRAAFSIAADRRARVRVRVTRAGRRLLNRAPRLRGRVVNVARDGAGQSKTIRAAVTIRRRAR